MSFGHPRYESREVLGQGAQGLVVRVIDRENQARALVAKVQLEGDPSAIEAEFALLSRLRIPGLPRVHDFGRDDAGRAFLVEDWIDGASIADELGSIAPSLRSESFVAIVADLVTTLGALHDAGFVHGDLKPAHVRISRGRAMLLDLGAALSRSATDANRFTPDFAAPELLAAARPHPGMDLYGLGATLYASLTFRPPPRPVRRGVLRARAPWLRPELEDVVLALLAEHPADRPTGGGDVLARLSRGRDVAPIPWEGGSARVHVRESVVRRLLRPGRAPVTYLVGPTGVGKSHVAREVFTRSLLSGVRARSFSCLSPDAAAVAGLVAFLRAEGPIASPIGDATFVVLDDLHHATEEVCSAVAVYSCAARAAPVTFLVTARKAPRGASVVHLGPLDDAELAVFAEEIGATEAAARDLHRESGGLPGWIVASLGRVPLTESAVLERVVGLPEDARRSLAEIALLGGTIPRVAVPRPASLVPLFREGLVVRSGDQLSLASTRLARPLAEALSEETDVDALAVRAVGEPSLASSSLLALASHREPPSSLPSLLAETARRAERERARATEIDALLRLSGAAAERTAARLSRLERLLRDAGTSQRHANVTEWLAETAEREPALRGLALRRRAEAAARRGDAVGGAELAEAARNLAEEEGDTLALALAWATSGAVALFSADQRAAEIWITKAHVRLASAYAIEPDSVDREELARVEHNLGVVALYAARTDEAAAAFERSLALKRALGDAAGARACLLNLGLARTKQGRFVEATAVLLEAVRLAESLEQTGGRAWCLLALAELEIRRMQPKAAERFVAEAESAGDALPEAARRDLALASVEIALLEGKSDEAKRRLAVIATDARAEDALVDARAHVLEARADLLAFPRSPRSAARLAIAAVRRARAASLLDVENEAIRVLVEARSRDSTPSKTIELGAARVSSHDEVEMPPAIWTIVEALAAGSDLEECKMQVLKEALHTFGAERVAWLRIDGGVVVEMLGIDLDGLTLGEVEKRFDLEFAISAIAGEGIARRSDRRGAALVTAQGSGALVLQHRFHHDAFDRVSREELVRWGTIAGLVARAGTSGMGPPSAVTSEAAPIEASPAVDHGVTTRIPSRTRTRAFPTILGKSPAIERALAALDRAVDVALPVLVTGETGTGKELFARALHEHGERSKAPFVAASCAAIADSLFEAELFGHARGAFTGADRARPGLFALAGHGTIFLDEIGELPLLRQASLLRVLESRRFRPVGADHDVDMNARVVAATNRDLDVEVAAGRFRKDLLYRLRVLEIAVPPLRARAGDIELLGGHFLASSRAGATFSARAKSALAAYRFPGNVRELHHMVQRLSALGEDRIELAHLPREMRRSSNVVPLSPRGGTRDVGDERAEVEDALRRTGGNISHAAERLGLTRHGLKKRMLRLGLREKTPVTREGGG